MTQVAGTIWLPKDAIGSDVSSKHKGAPGREPLCGFSSMRDLIFRGGKFDLALLDVQVGQNNL